MGWFKASSMVGGLLIFYYHHSCPICHAPNVPVLSKLFNMFKSKFQQMNKLVLVFIKIISITKSVLLVPHGIYIHTKNIPAISRRTNQYAKQTNLYLPMFCDENIFILKPSCEQTTCLLWL